jgi:hypothetical protein
MFPRRFFCGPFFAPRYFPQSSGIAPPIIGAAFNAFFLAVPQGQGYTATEQGGGFVALG